MKLSVLVSLVLCVALFVGSSTSTPQHTWPTLYLEESGKNAQYLHTLLSVVLGGRNGDIVLPKLKEERQQRRFGTETRSALNSFLCSHGFSSCEEQVEKVEPAAWLFLLEKALSENPSAVIKFAQSQSHLDLSKPANLKKLQTYALKFAGHASTELVSFVTSKAKRSEVNLSPLDVAYAKTEQSFGVDFYATMKQNLQKYVMEKISQENLNKIIQFKQFNNIEAKKQTLKIADHNFLVGVLEAESSQLVYLVLRPTEDTTITRHFEVDVDVRVTSGPSDEGEIQNHRLSLFVTGFSERTKSKRAITQSQSDKINRFLGSGMSVEYINEQLSQERPEDLEEELIAEGKYDFQLLGHSFLGQNSFKQAREAVQHLKVMSYNIWNYNADWPARAQAIANEVRKHNPDIISWQELRAYLSEGGLDTTKPTQIQDLAALLPEYQHIWQPAMFYPLAGQTEGTGLMSRFPIIEHSYATLSQTEGNSDHNQRICLHANILLPGNRTIQFFVAHFSYDPVGQMTNALESAHFIKETEKASLQRGVQPLGSIFAGDFNAGPSYEDPFNFLVGKKTVEGQRGDFKDLWKELKGSESGLTFSNLDSFVDRPDRILFKGEELKARGVVLTGHAYDSNGERMVPSDHLSIVGEFELNSLLQK